MSESTNLLLHYLARINAFMDHQHRLQSGEVTDDECRVTFDHIHEIEDENLRVAVVRAGFRLGVDALRMRKLFLRINDRLWDFLFLTRGQGSATQKEEAFCEAGMELQQALQPLLDLIACLPESEDLPKPTASVRARFVDLLRKNPEALGWSQRRIADAIDCSPSAISKYSSLLERLRAEQREQSRSRSSKAE